MPIGYPGNSISKEARAKAGGGFESAIEVVTSAWRANEPAGLTAHPILDFEEASIADQEGWDSADSNPANLTYVTDSTSPSPGDRVGRLVYPAGFSGGGSTVNIFVNSDAQIRKKMYVCIGLKMSSNFQFHLTGTNKVFFINVSGYGGGGDPYFFNINSDFTPARAGAVLQGPLPRVFTMPVDAGMQRDRWYTIEMLLTMNSEGFADGKYEQWVDGVKTNDDSDVEFVNTGYDFGLPKLQNTWGGAGDTVSEEFYLDCSELYVSWSETV